MGQTVAELLTALVRDAAAAAGLVGGPVHVEPCVPTNLAEHGDYQSNFAFRYAKAARLNPREVAQRLVDHLPASGVVQSAEVAGPGFVNFRLTNEWLGAELVRRAADPERRFEGPTPGAQRTVVIDYSSPNIAKRMHVGHLRSTIIGNALHRLYAYLGWRVVADNHIGDWGTQFGKLIVAWHRWRDEAAYADDAIGELQRLYQRFGEMADAEPELHDQARAETAKLQAGDEANLALWQQFVDASMIEFAGVYDRLDVRFDVTHGESFYNDALRPLVDDLLTRGLAVVNEGAVIVPFSAEDGKGLDKAPLLIRKSDGASLYGTTDLATVQHRVATWAPERAVYVTDTRQQLHFRQVFAAAKKCGLAGDMALVHVWFGMLRLPDGAITSTRKGTVLNLVDVLDAARDRARAIVDAKSGSLPAAERAEIAEAVGVGALRYFDLSQNPQTDITFDWDRSLAMDGNTAPYLMYAHARCRTLLRRADAVGPQPGPFSPGELVERDLALLVLRLPETVVVAAESARPNLVCDHLFSVANALSRFYDQCRVLDDDVAPDVRASRLALVFATAEALSLGMSLLGLKPLDRM